MSLLNLAKRALTRPISSSAFIAVGIAFVLLLHKTYSDRSVQQPVTTRNMHIQSIPMCEYLLGFTWLPAILQWLLQAAACARRSAPLPKTAVCKYISNIN
jgi:hypothetical protein